MAKNKTGARKARKPLNKKGATALWKLLDISVEKLTEAINVHASHTFVGYAYIQVRGKQDIPGLEFLQFGVTNCQVKLWSDDRVTVQFPEIKGDDGEYRPPFFPLTGEFRACVELAVKKDARVLKALERAAEARAEDSAAEEDGDESPFDDADLAQEGEEEVSFD